MQPSLVSLLVASACVAIAGALAGVRLTATPRFARWLIPAGGAALVLLCLFWILPELAQRTGWAASVCGLLAGVLLLALIDRYVYPVCPSCAHTHDHGHCSTRLHGFAGPIVVATALHAFFDGWGVALAGTENAALGPALVLGMSAHKLAEGLALGVILRAALRSRASAWGWAAAAEIPTVLGGMAGALVARELDPVWTTVLVSLAGGSYLYLGGHAMHSAPAVRAAGAPVLRLFTNR